MRFKTDENLPKEIAELLTKSGHDAIRVDEQGLAGVADPGNRSHPDPPVGENCSSRKQRFGQNSGVWKGFPPSFGRSCDLRSRRSFSPWRERSRI